MNKLIYSFFIPVLLLALFSGCGKKNESAAGSGINYTAYYFHPTARCESCINLESFLKELIEKKYAPKGFVFREVNIEDKENAHYRKDYSLKFSSVIISKTENGKETNWVNLDSVWSYTEKKEDFFRYSEREIDNFIETKK